MHRLRVEIIGAATLYLADCREVMQDIDADVLASDPPYEFDASGGGMFRSGRKAMDEIVRLGLDKGFDIKALPLSRLKAAALFCHNDQLVDLLPVLTSIFDRYVVCYWRKTNPLPLANKHYRPDTEFWVHAWQSDHPPGGDLREKARGWDGPVGKSEFDHPTVKPLAPMHKIVRNVGGKVVLDPFMGTGTTGLAALAQGRRFVGIEQSEVWFDVACRRLDAAVRQAEMFPPEMAQGV